MGITTDGLSVIASNMAGSSLPTNIAIGSGTNAFASGQSGLQYQTDSNLINDNDLTTLEQVTFISNFSPVEISGAIVTEFGTFTSGTVMLDRQVLTGSLVFDGEQELQIQETFKFFISG